MGKADRVLISTCEPLKQGPRTSRPKSYLHEAIVKLLKLVSVIYSGDSCLEEKTKMEPVNLPPPPYSEMDTYSSNISTSPSVTLTPTSTTVDHQSTLQSSPPRSAYIDTPITYTPPETPSGGPVCVLRVSL